MTASPSSSFTFDSLRKIIICLVCSHAVGPDIPKLKSHQRSQHQSGYKDEQWQEWISTFDHSSAISKSDHTGIQEAQRHGWTADLLTHSDGYQCTIPDCLYYAPKLDTMQKHVKDQHPEHPLTAASWKHPVAISSIFGSGQSPWFPVIVPDAPLQSVKQDFAAALAAFEDHLHAVSLQDACVSGETDPRHVDLWANTTQHHVHFANMDMKKQSALADLVPLPDDRPNAVAHVRSAVGRFVADYHQQAKGQLFSLLKIVRQIDHEPSTKPLRHIFDQSLVAYTLFWVHCVLYFIRTYPSRTEHRYSLTVKQIEVLGRCEVAITDDEPRKLEAHLPDFVLSLLEEDITGNKLYSPLIHFFGIAAWSRKRFVFKDAFESRPMFSHAVYLLRLVSLQYGQELGQAPGGNRAEALENYCRQYLRVGTNGPFTEIQHLRQRAKTIGNTYYVHPSLNWWPDRNGLCYQGSPIALDKLFSVVQDTLGAAEDTIISRLVFSDTGSPELARYDPENIKVDDMNWRAIRQSFVDFSSNDLGGGAPRLLERARHSACGSRLFAPSDSNRNFSAPRRLGLRTASAPLTLADVEKYLGTVHQAREKLAFLIHVLGGLPARGTEIATVQYCNSQLSLRNVYVRDGLVLILIEYNKTEGVTEEPKIIGRYLPWRLSRLLVMFVADVIPFAEFLEVQIGRGVNRPRSTFLFQTDGTPWASEAFSKILGDEFERSLGVRLGLSKWRDVIIAIDQECLRSRLDSTLDDRDFLMHTRMAGHGRAMEKHHYAQQLERSTVNAEPQTLKRWFEVCRLVHKLFGVHKEPDHLKVSPEPFWAERLRGPSAAPTLPARNHKRPAPALPTDDPRKRTRAHSDPPPSPGHSTAGDDILRQLQRIHPGAQFKPGQRESVEAVMSGTHVLSILPTGGGKGEVLSIPASLSREQITLVVVPTNALKTQLLERCGRLGLDSTVWSPTGSNLTSVVLVVPEQTLSERFGAYISGICSRGRLGRIVFDEAHGYIYDAGWRHSLREMAWLAKAKAVQRVFLTGSLPPRVEDTFRHLMDMTPLNSVTVRVPTARRDISFHVRHSLAPSIADVSPLIRARIARNERCIVFTKSVADHAPLAEALHHFHPLSYHGGAVSAAEQADTIRRFEAGASSVIIATTALATGVDLRRMGLIIFWHGSFSLVDLAQQSGRAGRHGERAQVLVLIPSRLVHDVPGSGSTPDQRHLHDFLTTSNCRFGVLSRYLDGEIRSCADQPATSFCDNCRVEKGLPLDVITPEPSVDPASYFPDHAPDHGSGNDDQGPPRTHPSNDDQGPPRTHPSNDDQGPPRTHASNSTASDRLSPSPITPEVTAASDGSVDTSVHSPSTSLGSSAFADDPPSFARHVRPFPLTLPPIPPWDRSAEPSSSEPSVLDRRTPCPRARTGPSSFMPLLPPNPPKAPFRHTLDLAPSRPPGREDRPISISASSSPSTLVPSSSSSSSPTAGSMTVESLASLGQPPVVAPSSPRGEAGTGPDRRTRLSSVSHVSDSSPPDVPPARTALSSDPLPPSLGIPRIHDVNELLPAAWPGLVSRCWACWLNLQDRDHAWEDCDHSGSITRGTLTAFATAMRKRLDRTLKLDWSCFLPLYAERLKHASECGGGKCQYRDLVLTLILLASMQPQYWPLFGPFDVALPLPGEFQPFGSVAEGLMRLLGHGRPAPRTNMGSLFAAILAHRSVLADSVGGRSIDSTRVQ